MAGIEQAGPGDVTFLANTKYTAALAATRASAVILDGAGAAGAVRGAAHRQPVPGVRPGRAGVRAAPRAAARRPSLGGGRRRRRARGRRRRRPAGRDRPPRPDRRRAPSCTPHVVIGDDAVLGPDCRDPRPRVDPRGVPPRPPRRRAGRRRDRRRRLRLRPSRRRHPREDSADRAGRDRGRRRDRRQHHHRPAGGGRDAHQGRAPRSTTWCRSPTASTVGLNTLLASQVGIAGSTVDRRRRDPRRSGRASATTSPSATA